MPFAQRQVTVSVGMVQEIVIDKVQPGVTIDAARFDPPTEDASDLTFAQGDRAEDIPFKFTENHIYVPVVVKGKERIWVLDSGAEMKKQVEPVNKPPQAHRRTVKREGFYKKG